MQLYMERYGEWLKGVKEPKLMAELAKMSGDEKLIEESFYTELSFGTAGLRGVLGAGSNRMNVYVVRRATAGLAGYIKRFEGAAERGVAVAYDSRRMSMEFARETALALADSGVKAYLFTTLHSVPQLSFAVRHCGCIAGVVITASHNPPEYNGYKVYWEHGGQADPEQAAGIFEEIQKRSYFDVPMMDEAEARERGLLIDLGAAEDEAYYREAEGLLLCGDLIKRKGSSVKIVYTPLHGTGFVPVRELMARQGMEVVTVAEQAEPDGDFPTVSAPNPEDPRAFGLAIPLAKRVGANLILATDPDADRLGVAVKNGDDFDVLSGNRIGCLLLNYILTVRSERGALPKDSFIVRSIVSTRMADDIASRFGVRTETVPTGFRFISERIAEAELSNGGGFLFGFEESYGFLAGGGSRDKDAVSSAMLLCEAAVYYNEKGMTLADVLERMYHEYGFHGEKVQSYTLKGKEGLERIRGAMEALRREPPTRFGEADVVLREDLLTGERVERGVQQAAAFGGHDVLIYTLSNGAWLCVRPSGTEPKLKLSIGAKAGDRAQLDLELERAFKAADARLTMELGL